MAFWKNPFGRSSQNDQNETESASDPPISETQPIIEEPPANSHQEAEIRRFKSTIIGTLTEPKVAHELLLSGWGFITLLGIVGYFSGWYISSICLILLVTFLLGIRRIPSVHCGLLYNFGRRTRIGFWEGFVWIPWMTGGLLKTFNVEQFSYDIAKEDTWTNDRMHLIFDLVIRFGVIPVNERGNWTNFFWFFHVLSNSETYEDYVDSGADLGEGMFRFVENPDVENALVLVTGDAKESVRKVLRTKGFEEIFRFTVDGAEPDPEKTALIEKQIEDLMQKMLTEKISKIGLRVSELALADIDFDKEAISALQQMQIKPILAKAEALSYDELAVIAAKFAINPKLGEATFRTITLKALQTSAEAGLLGPLLHGTILEKMAPLTALPENIIINPSTQ